jgi:hypothetical protein
MSFSVLSEPEITIMNGNKQDKLNREMATMMTNCEMENFFASIWMILP